MLADCEWRAGPYRWPVPLMARLRELVALANEAGARTNQGELLAALLLTSPTEASDLKTRVELLRTATSRRAFVSAPPALSSADVPRPSAGRPRRA